ncbi:hypothetical protein B0H14DRAFT_2859293 [Mycena olivaceomarginata]|nr:hypothetical protein B0H14DRAFT_2859293 [Mycena olivaceomarginata]
MGEFDQTIGFTLMGVIINTYLTGLIMSQFFSYWNSGAGVILSLVAFLFLVNTAQASAVVYMSWNFSNPQVVAIYGPYPFTALTTAVLAITNQLFQSWRIYQFTRNKILVGFLVATSLAACGMALAKLVALQPVVEANLALQCGVDVIVADAQVLNTMIRNAVQSGSFTVTIFALGTLFSFRFAPGTYMLALFALPIGRIYTHIFPSPLSPKLNATNRDPGTTTDSTSIMLRTTSSGAKIHETLAGQSNSGTYDGESHQHKSVPVIG